MTKRRRILVVLAATVVGVTAIAATSTLRLRSAHAGSTLAILAICAPVLLGVWSLRARRLRGRLERPVLAAAAEVLAVAGIVGVFALSLVGRDGVGRVVDLDPLGGDVSSGAMRLRILGNFLMVTPAAAAAALRVVPLRRVGTAVLTGGALMLALEASQYAVGGRVTSLQDWLLGTAGWTLTCVAVGAVLARTRLPDPSRPAVERSRSGRRPGAVGQRGE